MTHDAKRLPFPLLHELEVFPNLSTDACVMLKSKPSGALSPPFSYLHGLRICHRDLKPENCLLASQSSDTDFKLADFGTAVRLDVIEVQPNLDKNIETTEPTTYAVTST